MLNAIIMHFSVTETDLHTHKVETSEMMFASLESSKIMHTLLRVADKDFSYIIRLFLEL